MNILVRIVALGLAVVIVPSSVLSQLPRRLFAGERPIEMVRDIDDKPRIAKAGTPCGEYFLVDTSDGEEIISFKVAGTKQEERSAVQMFVRVPRQSIEFIVEESRPYPTAEWEGLGPSAPSDSEKMIVRISERHYQAADCLNR